MGLYVLSMDIKVKSVKITQEFKLESWKRSVHAVSVALQYVFYIIKSFSYFINKIHMSFHSIINSESVFRAYRFNRKKKLIMTLLINKAFDKFKALNKFKVKALNKFKV